MRLELPTERAAGTPSDGGPCAAGRSYGSNWCLRILL